jgi:hypothetical protein
LTACPVPPKEGLLVEPVEDKQLLQHLQSTESIPLMSKTSPQATPSDLHLQPPPQTPNHKP